MPRAAIVLILGSLASCVEIMAEDLPPVRQITSGPKFHWFGYYDKLEFDPTSRYVLANEADFEGRSPTADDVLRVGMVDLADHDQWIELGTSRAWAWQTGCMLQWRPGSKSEVLWNDREGDRFVCRIFDVLHPQDPHHPHANPQPHARRPTLLHRRLSTGSGPPPRLRLSPVWPIPAKTRLLLAIRAFGGSTLGPANAR